MYTYYVKGPCLILHSGRQPKIINKNHQHYQMHFYYGILKLYNLKQLINGPVPGIQHGMCPIQYQMISNFPRISPLGNSRCKAFDIFHTNMFLNIFFALYIYIWCRSNMFLWIASLFPVFHIWTSIPLCLAWHETLSRFYLMTFEEVSLKIFAWAAFIFVSRDCTFIFWPSRFKKSPRNYINYNDTAWPMTHTYY